MGYAECGIIMEPKRVSASPVSGCSLSSLRGQSSLKSSTFCPGSSSRTTRAIIQDHMVSHYKKVYSAKAVVDASVPKSLTCSVKYNDQIKREQLRKGDRPHSAHSLSQRNSRASCLSSRRWRSVHGEEYFCPERSMVSTPKFTTSFHAKQIVYPSFTVGGFQGLSHNVRPSSEFDYRSPQPTGNRQPSAHSSAPPGTQSSFKSFQDPVQKTYSGDLLEKHSHYFTQEDKPFTPRTLKSDKSSYLAQYRYYTSPRNKQNQGCTNSALLRQETYHGSTQTREYSSTEFDDPPQGFSTEYDWSEDESNGLSVSVNRQQNKNVKSRSSSFFLSSSRFSPAEGIKSPLMMRVSAEEEELMYLEFIADVTSDILTRGLFSNRVLERVFQRHINTNKHRLDEGKMRHRLEALRKDFNSPTCSADVETKENNVYEQPLGLERSVSSSMETKEDNNLLPYASLVKDHVSPGGAVPLYVSTHLYACSKERTVLATEAGKEDFEDLGEKRGTESPTLFERVSKCAVVNEEGLHSHQVYNTLNSQEYKLQRNDYTTVTGDEGLHLITSEDNRDELSNALEDLGRSLSESLHVSGNTFNNDQEAVIEQHNTYVSLSDDEF